MRSASVQGLNSRPLAFSPFEAEREKHGASRFRASAVAAARTVKPATSCPAPPVPTVFARPKTFSVSKNAFPASQNAFSKLKKAFAASGKTFSENGKAFPAFKKAFSEDGKAFSTFEKAFSTLKKGLGAAKKALFSKQNEPLNPMFTGPRCTPERFFLKSHFPSVITYKPRCFP